MIKLTASGKYRLAETHNSSKLLYLDSEAYIWRPVAHVGHMLGLVNNPKKTDSYLAVGNYRLYDVKDEAGFTDNRHLELFLGSGRWQGYLLPDGLPADGRTMHRIIATHELITARQESQVCANTLNN